MMATETRTDSTVTRDIRQREIIPPERLAACHAIVIGVGAIGRQVALQLAAVGVPAMTLFDHDIVGIENLATQGYWQADVGQQKVRSTAAACCLLNPQIVVTGHAERFRRSSIKLMSADGSAKMVVFCCVDDIEARRLIWESIRAMTDLFVDGRMSAEVIRVIASEHPASDSYYASTLFLSAEAHQGSCTAKSTIYTASIAGGLLLSAFTRWLRALPIERDITLNLLAAELSVA